MRYVILGAGAIGGTFGGEDVVLLTCKAQHTAGALGELRTAKAPPELPVVCCHRWPAAAHRRGATASPNSPAKRNPRRPEPT